MRIVSARVIVTCPGRNFVTLKIVTSSGLTGVGDATLNGREMAVVAYLREHVVPALIGRDPARIEDTWQFLYRGAYWRRGPVTMTAVAAVDTALWDIKGKVAGLPVYQLLGGRSRSGVLVYGHASGPDIAGVLDSVSTLVASGYQAVRVQSGIPGLSSVYGVSSDPVYEPASSALPATSVWSTTRYLGYIPTVFEAVRASFGPSLRLLHDAHHRLSPVEAAQLGKALEAYGLTWLEDPVPAEDQSAYRLLRRHTTTPLAVGEVFNSVWDCLGLISEHLIDYIRTSVVHAGGITHLRRIFDLAALYQVRSGSHGASDLSPVCMAAALHVDVAIPNFGLQEYMPHTPETDAVFPHGYRFADGYLHPSEEPGLGVDIDEELAARYPYRPAALPVNRLEDGTLHDW
ncbi:D-galactonate dehydratase family protein [Actinoplanes sp. TBRC 11911]|uniref:D-mannonate dehydratase ManD n=1 Tax=Actinoplanes sp. TBRC 11911 TaxID=2729386 RepID=UPI00145C491B|nr:D-mannonate dehydratase ManD [Actinoplanes sp. TBRC 11911]NMO54016.1 D-galactonate dehydratase family protein [Actinoplanes sp. TBRC 11911]